MRPSIIATHLTEIIKRYAADILGRQEIQGMLDALKKDYPAVVEDAQKHLSLGEIQKVLQGLLREQVSIRNLVAILETLADYAGVTKDPGFLVEKARQTLGRQICLQYADTDKTIRVLTIESGTRAEDHRCACRYAGRGAVGPGAGTAAPVDQGPDAGGIGGAEAGALPVDTVLGGRAGPRKVQHRARDT